MNKMQVTFSYFYTGRKKQKKMTMSGSRTEIPNLADHEAVQR